MHKQIEAEGYTILPEGIVISKRGAVLKTRVNHKGYVRVSPMVGGKQRHFYLHVVIASKFCNKEDHHTQVNHKDGNRQNNHKDNLEWCTGSENILHKFYGDKQGDELFHAKVLALKGKGLSMTSISKELGVCMATAHKYWHKEVNNG